MGALSIIQATKRARRFLIDTNAVDIMLRSESKSVELKRVRRADLYISYATLVECLAGCHTTQAVRRRVNGIHETVADKHAEEAPGVRIGDVLKYAFALLVDKRPIFAAKGDSGIGDAYNAALALSGKFVIVTTDPDFTKIDGIDWLEGWI